MRTAFAGLVVVLLLAACSRHTPPHGRWEGTLDRPDAMVAARVEVEDDNKVRISAPNAEDVGYDEAARASMRQHLAVGLVQAWEEVEPRPMDFDGRVFRKPNGIAPQMIWDHKTKRMFIVVYLGKREGIQFKLRHVDDFSNDPWAE